MSEDCRLRAGDRSQMWILIALIASIVLYVLAFASLGNWLSHVKAFLGAVLSTPAYIWLALFVFDKFCQPHGDMAELGVFVFALTTAPALGLFSFASIIHRWRENAIQAGCACVAVSMLVSGLYIWFIIEDRPTQSGECLFGSYGPALLWSTGLLLRGIWLLTSPIRSNVQLKEN